jgi:hypothetical protein
VPNPLSSQCHAMSKRSGRRCRRMVVGGGSNAVCTMHGGAAPQVRAANAARLIELRAQLAAGEREPQPPRHPAEVLLSSIDGADQVMSQLRRDFAAGLLSPELSRAYGEALDRAGRLAKLALDARTDERLVRVSELQAARLIRTMDRVLNDPRVAIIGDPRAVVLDAIRAEDLVPEQPERLALSS